MLTWIILGLIGFILIGYIIKECGGFETNINSPLMIFGEYIGGCSTIYDTNFDITITVDVDKLNIGSYMKKIDLNIPIDKINTINLKSESEIKSEVTLGRLLVLGIFAFGLPKKTKHVSKFAVINYLNDRNENENMILEAKNIGQIVEKIHLLKHKINQIA